MDFASLRIQLRNLEHQADQLLGLLSTGASLQSAERLEQELHNALQERQEVLDGLRQLVNRDNSQQTYKVQLQQVDRHRDIFIDHRNEFRRLQRLIRDMRDREQLLASATTRRLQERVQYDLQQEQYKIEQSNSIANELLAQAFATRDALIDQRNSLKHVQQKMQQALLSLPTMNNLLRYVGTRKRRDSILLALIVTLGFFGLFFFL